MTGAGMPLKRRAQPAQAPQRGRAVRNAPARCSIALARFAPAAWLLLFGSPLRGQPLPAPLFVNSREISLSLGTAGATPTSVSLYVSTDDGQTWELWPREQPGPATLTFTAPGDGRYAAYLVLDSTAGRSAAPPRPGSRPHALIVVDTAPPTLQLHDAVAVLGDADRPVLRLTVSLLEEHLTDGGVRLFYKPPLGSPWRDGGPVTIQNGRADWPLPADALGALDVMLVATDRAGNRASDQRSVADCSPPRPTAWPAPASAPARSTLQPKPQPKAASQPSVPASQQGDPSASQAAVEPPTAKARQLRDAAAKLAADGRLALAAARLQDALESSPGQPELLIDLGNVLCRSKRYDEARLRFQAALEADPTAGAALEGLGLAAVAEKRFADAATHLAALVKLQPECGRCWLRLGDVQHQRGLVAEARQAWRRALENGGATPEVRDGARARLERFGIDADGRSASPP